MSRLSELIAELCSDGVEYKALGELCKKTSSIKWAEHEGESYQYIDLTSVSRDYHCIEATESIDAQTAPSRAKQFVAAGDILFGATRPTLMRYCEVPPEFDSQIASTGYAVFRFKNGAVIPRYAMHCFGIPDFMEHLETYQKGTAYPAISMRDLKRFRIPVPPIEAQREVVRILDEYTAAHDELVRQLENKARLAAEQLLALCDELICRQEYPRVAIGEIGNLERVKRFTASDYVEDGIPSIHYGEVYTEYSVSTTETVSHLRPDLSTSLRYAKQGDVIIACTGENKDDICKPVAWLGATDVAVHDDCHILHHNMNARYVAYALMTNEFHEQKIRVATESKVVRVSGKKLASMSIPAPSIHEQQRIASLLDRAFSYSNAMTSESETEIGLLREQAVLIRNQLLSFPERKSA